MDATSKISTRPKEANTYSAVIPITCGVLKTFGLSVIVGVIKLIEATTMES
jgi:hypothetical protein